MGQEQPMTPISLTPSISPLFIALILAGAAVPANADSLSKLVDIADGDRLAHTLCVNCHVVDTNGPVIRTDRVPSFSWIANQKGLTANTLPAWLSTSHERMPDFALTRDEIRKVSAYIMSLRTS
jgi:mono/diheme cytochrome c family protein